MNLLSEKLIRETRVSPSGVLTYLLRLIDDGHGTNMCFAMLNGQRERMQRVALEKYLATHARHERLIRGSISNDCSGKGVYVISNSLYSLEALSKC
jgi:hypothetical protein